MPMNLDAVGAVSNPNRISWTSKGTLPVQTRRSIENGLLPREPQPRLVPPAKSEPSLPKRTGTTPEPKPCLNGKHAPW